MTAPSPYRPPGPSVLPAVSVIALVASAATLAVTGLVAIALAVTAEAFPLNANTVSSFALLVVLVSPIALLLAWGEVDLSFIGTITMSGYVYAELSDSGMAVALVVAVLVATLVGLLVGVLRFVLRIPSALLSAGAGAAVAALSLRLSGAQGTQVAPDGVLDNAVLPVLGALGVVAVATVVAATVRSRGADGRRPVGDLPGPEVVLGYALSGFGAGVAGALTTAQIAFYAPGQGQAVLLAALAALAISGAARGSGVVAPVAGAAAALLVGVIEVAMAGAYPFDVGLVLAGLLLFSLVLGHAIHRVAPVMTPVMGGRVG